MYIRGEHSTVRRNKTAAAFAAVMLYFGALARFHFHFGWTWTIASSAVLFTGVIGIMYWNSKWE